MNGIFPAIMCANKQCQQQKEEQCIRDHCIKSVRKMLTFMDKKVDGHILVHQQHLKESELALKEAKIMEEKQMLRKKIKLGKEYIKMYQAYKNCTTESEKMKWFVKYYI